VFKRGLVGVYQHVEQQHLYQEPWRMTLEGLPRVWAV
jgi:hypothetical protein